MSENLFSKHYPFKGRYIFVIIKPHFYDALDIFRDTMEISTSAGEPDIQPNHHLSDCTENWVYAPKSASWVVITKDIFTHIYITEKTKKITKDLGNGLSNVFNSLIHQTKYEYSNQKKNEVRLYFWDSQKKILRLCLNNNKITSTFPEGKIAYYYRRFSAGQAIDKQDKMPDQDCLILGRVRKTIGTKNSKLFDYIEPLSEIKLDFEKEKWDYFGCEFREKLDSLERIMLNLLIFCVSHNDKNMESVEYNRIRAYLRTTHKTASPDIQVFMDEVKAAFKEGNVAKLRALEDVLSTPQDCSNVEFKIKFKNGFKVEKEITCSPEKNFSIYYTNGEYSYETARWIAQNISKCTNANVTYYELRNMYNFF